MYYSLDLLSRRRRGKLAACWLAATSRETLFKRYYKSVAIKNMDTIQICEEILRAIQSYDSKILRFNLYLSSQLMYGVTKIHSYQITYYQREISEIWQKLNFFKSSKKEISPVRDPDFMIELPSLIDLINSANREDVNLLPSEEFDDKLKMMMQGAHLNFGILTNKELDILLDNDTAFKEMRFIDDSKEREIIQMMTDIEISQEIHRVRHSPRGIHSPMLMNVSETKTKSKGTSLPTTPQKRQTRQSQEETPTKRIRLSLEDAAIAVPVPSEDVIIPELPVEETLVPAPPLSTEQTNAPPLQQAELDMELESLNSSSFIIKAPKKYPKRSIIIDEETILENELLYKWRGNIKIWCKKFSSLAQVLAPLSVAERLKQPSTIGPTKRWACKLYNMFNNRISKPLSIPKEDIAPAEMQIQEAIRLGETTSKLDPTEEWSTFLAKLHATTIANESALKSIPNIPPMIERTEIIHETEEISTVPPVLAETNILEQDINITDHVQKKTDANETAESLLDIENMSEKQRSESYLKKDRISKSSTPISQPGCLTNPEIMAMLEVFWCDQPCIKFSQFISSDTYTKADAATVFDILLELHAKKKIVLQQAALFRTLWIRKY